MIAAVIYARYSSSGQKEESIEGQIRECREYAKRNGLTVVGEYIDKAMTGRSDHRPDFQRMIRDSAKGLFQRVICWKMDRFARNRYDFANYKAKLRKNGVTIEYARETMPEGAERIVLESLMEGMAEYYSANLSENIKRGNYDCALKMQTLGRRVLGYRRGADGRYEIDPATAPAIKMIFDLYSQGVPAVEIVQELNGRGYRTAAGKPFQKSSLTRILKNEKYKGVYTYLDKIRVEDGIPPIVDKDTWEKCQRMAEKHKIAPAANRDTNFRLTGKLFCGHCGQAMTGESARAKNGTIHHYYTCYGKRKHTCDKRREPKDKIEEKIVGILIRLIHSDEFIQLAADGVMSYQESRRDTSELDALKARQKEVNRKIENLMSAIEEGIITPTTKGRLMDLEAAKQSIEIAIAQEQAKRPTLTRAAVVEYLEKMRKGKAHSKQYEDALIRVFLNRVYLYDDKIKIVLNYTKKDANVSLADVEKMGESNSCIDAFSVPSNSLPRGGLILFCPKKHEKQKSQQKPKMIWRAALKAHFSQSFLLSGCSFKQSDLFICIGVFQIYVVKLLFSMVVLHGEGGQPFVAVGYRFVGKGNPHPRRHQLFDYCEGIDADHLFDVVNPVVVYRQHLLENSPSTGTIFPQDQGLCQNFREGDVFAGKGMVHRAYPQKRLLPIQGIGGVAVFLFFKEAFYNGKIQLVALQHGQQYLRVVDGELQIVSGVGEVLDQLLFQHKFPDGFGGADPQQDLTFAFQAGAQFVFIKQHGFGILFQLFRCFGFVEHPAGVVKQLFPVFLFQGMDVLGDGRLRNVQLFRCFPVVHRFT